LGGAANATAGSGVSTSGQGGEAAIGAGGTAGAVGEAGTPGAGGSIAAGGMDATGQAGSTGMMGGRPSGPSLGCAAVPPEEPPLDPVQHDLMVAVPAQYAPQYEPRYYFTNLPQNYDSTHPYPVVLRGNGCGQTVPEGGVFSGGHFSEDVLLVQLIKADVSAETVVPSNGAPGCFQAGRQGLADSPDGPYFDQVLAEVAARYCIDLGQVYVAGWSSGAWLTNYLACSRGDVIAGTVSGSGGLQHDHGDCKGGAAVMIFPGDAGSTNEDSFDIGAAVARDLFIETNGCSTTPTTMSFGNANNCEYYGDCDAPVVYCNDGGGHGGPLEFMSDSGWDFWTSLQE
jgi:poly(3-hydroxybutyrate) depolymerase